MKKIFVIVLLFLSTKIFASPWDCYKDDPKLKRIFDEINETYFNSELKIDHIDYNAELPDSCLAITYHWSPYTAFPDREVIVVNPILLEKDDGVIRSVIAHECCHVYVDQNDQEVRYYGYTGDGHDHEMFHTIMKQLYNKGCNLWIPIGWKF